MEASTARDQSLVTSTKMLISDTVAPIHVANARDITDLFTLVTDASRS